MRPFSWSSLSPIWGRGGSQKRNQGADFKLLNVQRNLPTFPAAFHFHLKVWIQGHDDIVLWENLGFTFEAKKGNSDAKSELKHSHWIIHTDVFLADLKRNSCRNLERIELCYSGINDLTMLFVCWYLILLNIWTVTYLQKGKILDVNLAKAKGWFLMWWGHDVIELRMFIVLLHDIFIWF